MAIIPVRKPINVENLYVNALTCLLCENTINTHLKGPETRKPCPHCSKGTFVIQVTPMRGYIHVGVVFQDLFGNVTLIEISPEQVEIAEEI